MEGKIKMKHAMKVLLGMKVLLSLTAVLVVLAGCEEAASTKTVTIVDRQPYEAGDVLPGSWTVTYADDLGGLLAERGVDGNDDGDLLDAEDTISVLVTGQFGSDLTLPASKAGSDADYSYYLSGTVVMGGDNENSMDLTIGAGALIKGEVSSTAPGVLVINRGSRILAEGTDTDPIVFTSANDVGDRAAEDWGGLVILGNGISDKGPTALAEAINMPWGGTDNADDSGILKYVRVEFAGTTFDGENELNGIAFYGVGSETTVSYVQVHRNGDDGVEFFGGAVEADHLVLTGEADDSLDYDNGWTGGAQFVIIQQYTDYGDKLIEGDGESNPTSDPYMANLTMVSPREEYAHFKVGSEGALVNSVAITAKSYAFKDDLASDDFVYAGVVTNAPDQTTKTYDADEDASTTADNNTIVSPVFNALANTVVAAGVDQVNYSATSEYELDNAVFEVTPGTVTVVTDLASVHADIPVNAAYIGAVDPSATAPYWFQGWTTEAQN